MRDYLERELSSFDDRLLVLAGIVTELAGVWNDTYMAGFWGRTIVKHLAWYRTEHKPRSSDARPKKDLFEGVVDCTRRLGGPTWSWVMAAYPVATRKLRHLDIQLVDSGVKLASQKSPFGHVQSAFIALEARVLDAAEALTSGGVEFRTWSERSLYHDDGVLLDFEEPKPQIKKCRLLYLGEDDRSSYPYSWSSSRQNWTSIEG